MSIIIKKNIQLDRIDVLQAFYNITVWFLAPVNFIMFWSAENLANNV